MKLKFTTKEEMENFLKDNPKESLSFVIRSLLEEFTSTLNNSITCCDAKIKVYKLLVKYYESEIKILESQKQQK